eukprot:gene51917-70766_t
MSAPSSTLSHSAGSITDVAGIEVGHFSDTRRPTGCTVIMARDGAVGGVDVRGAAPGTRELLPFSPMFAMTWLIGGTCAVAAAWQAKFHRLAALMLAAGAGLVSCVTYIWFSAPDLALTQLVVEAVTTVLILLG